MGNRHSTNNHVVTEIRDVSKYGYYEYKFSPTNRIFRLFYKNPKFGEIRPKLIENAIISLESTHWDQDSDSSSYDEIIDVKPAEPITLTLSVLDTLPSVTCPGYYGIISAPRNEYPEITLYIKNDKIPDPESLKCKTITATAEFLSGPNNYRITSYTISTIDSNSTTLKTQFKVVDIIPSYKQDGYLEVIPDRQILTPYPNSIHVTIFITLDPDFAKAKRSNIVADLELFALPNRYRIVKWHFLE